MKGKWLIAGGLLVAELALCATIVAIMWSGIGQIGTPQFRWGGFGNDRVSVETDEEQRFTVDGAAVLTVNKGVQSSFGNISVVGGAGDTVVVTAHKTAWGADGAAAQAELDKLKVVVTQNKNTLDVRVSQPEPVVTIMGNIRPNTVDLVVTVPLETSVDLNTDFGDLTVSGTQGDVSLDTNAGKVSVKQVKGGSLGLESDFGDMTLDHVEADSVEVHSNAGKITLTEVEATGAITLESDFGELRFEHGRAGSLDMQTNSGEVTLNDLNVQGTATLKSDFGEVNVTQVVARSYELRSNSGNLVLAGASGSVIAHTDFGNVTVSEAQEATLDLSTNSGNIDFAGSLGKGPHILDTDFGRIRLRLPKATALTLDLKTDFGQIHSELPVTLTGSQENGHWQGQLNGGGDELTAQTNSGEITIEKVEP